MSEDAGIEPRTLATSALAVRRSNHSARSHLIHVQLSLGRMTNIEYIQNKQIRESVQCPVRYGEKPLHGQQGLYSEEVSLSDLTGNHTASGDFCSWQVRPLTTWMRPKEVYIFRYKVCIALPLKLRFLCPPRGLALQAGF